MQQGSSTEQIFLQKHGELWWQAAWPLPSPPALLRMLGSKTAAGGMCDTLKAGRLPRIQCLLGDRTAPLQKGDME